jgi:hypothetical protein
MSLGNRETIGMNGISANAGGKFDVFGCLFPQENRQVTAS